MIKAMDMGAICSTGEQSSWRKYGRAGRGWGLVAQRPDGRAEPPGEAEHFSGAPIQPEGGKGAAHARIERVINHMLGNLNKPLRVSALSKLAGISDSHFYHLFKEVAGCPPNDFFIRIRMARAGKLLRETGLSVKEVAARLGYNDQFYFSRLFKAVNGVPPSEYVATVTEQPGGETRATLRPVEKETPDRPPALSAPVRTGRFTQAVPHLNAARS